MIRWSDNAATDYLLERVGGPEAVTRFARARGMTAQEPVVSIFGTFVA
jgi:beta-lactamase class A